MGGNIPLVQLQLYLFRGEAVGMEELLENTKNHFQIPK